MAYKLASSAAPVKLHPFGQRLDDLHSRLCRNTTTPEKKSLFMVEGVVDVCGDVFRHYFTATVAIAEHLLAYAMSSSSCPGPL